jgi:aryl-phospho-beta-D-glucosidase BglC (GH1 family)
MVRGIRSLTLACLTVFLVTALPLFAQQQDAPDAQGRLARLRHGVNLSGWFAQVYDKQGYTKEHFQSWTTPDDIALIKAMGFDHVRLGVNPQPMFNSAHPDQISAEYLAEVDAAVRMILDHDLAVIIDIHPDDDFKAQMKDDVFVQKFTDFWRALARHYAKYDPERVFLEVMNEPVMSDPYRWSGIQAKLVAAIREGAPQHTIIATGAKWSNDDELVFLDPLRDSNVIYNFHFYFPHLFTHQGATWGAYSWQWVKGLSYPSTPESATRAAAAVPDAQDRLAVIRYGYEHWDAARIDAEINQVAEWSRKTHVPVICNEFGVYREYADPHDRAAWLNDVRTSLEKHGIGWTVWDYSGSFGVVTKANGHATPDELAVPALGLKPPRVDKNGVPTVTGKN